MSNPVRLIRSATAKDIPAILAIMEQNFIHQKTARDKAALESAGFLIHGFSLEDIQHAIEDETNHIVLVATENNTVMAYLLNHDLKKFNAWVHGLQSTPAYVALLANEKVLYHRHIAKMPQTQGIGKPLLQTLIREATLRQYHYLVCQILQKPYQNKVSLQLHEAFGFVQIGVVDEGEYTFGVYLKSLL